MIIRAELLKDDTASAEGIMVRSSSPILALCRKLIEAGHDPASRLEAYRGQTLCLKVGSIGEAARLQVGSHGVGFEAAPACGARPPMHLIKEAAE